MLFRLILLILVMLPGWAVAKECTKLSASGNAEYPPYLWRVSTDSQQMQGAIALLMEYVSQQLGKTIDLRYVGSWGRVQEEVAEGEIDLIAGAFYTEKRSYRMNYIRPAFQQTRTAVWVRKDQPFVFNQWSDLQNRAGVTVINNSFGQQFDDYARQNLDIYEAVRLSQGLQMLIAGRVDYFVYEENPARAYAAELELLHHIRPMEQALSSEDLYLTISRKSSCNTEQLRQRLADIMQQANEQGLMQQYLQRSVEQWRQRSKQQG